MENEKLLSRVEAAELLRLSVFTIRRYEKAERLRSIKLSQNCVRYRQSEVLQLIESAAK
jgi:predicted DNA-binding transcriptional regulator AlpA